MTRIFRKSAGKVHGPGQIMVQGSFTTCGRFRPPYHVGRVSTAWWLDDKKVKLTGIGLAAALAERNQLTWAETAIMQSRKLRYAVSNTYSAGA